MSRARERTKKEKDLNDEIQGGPGPNFFLLLFLRTYSHSQAGGIGLYLPPAAGGSSSVSRVLEDARKES